jgi:hypothetical protein
MMVFGRQCSMRRRLSRCLSRRCIAVTLAAVVLAVAGAAGSAGAQQFSATLVDAQGIDTIRTPFYVGDTKMRWVFTRGDTVTGGVILDFRSRTLVGLDVPTRTFFEPTGEDPAADQAEVFLIMRPTDAADPCRGWNAAAVTDRAAPPHFACRNLGPETVDGRATQKWELTYARSGRKAYAWIDPRLRYLIRLQDPTSGSTTDVRDIKEGPQPADLFSVPSNYHKIDPPPKPPRTQ